MSRSDNSTALAEWLRRLEERAPSSRIELGLERVRRVWKAMAVPVDAAVITVAGTNGKGSVVAMLEAMLGSAGHRTMAYTSPHLLRFSERMRIDGREAGESAIVAALDAVERARGDVALTYFEHTTLAGLQLAAESKVDVLLLEVGLGGRLDAVNVIDADVAVITSIGIDHAEFLGDTRELIALEKAGVARAGRPVVVGDPDPPGGLIDALDKLGAQVIDAHACLSADTGRIDLCHGNERFSLPEPALAGDWQRDNAACAVLALLALADRLPVSTDSMAEGLLKARLPGRFQTLRERPLVVVDVAHNPAAARALARALGPAEGRSTAVFSALTGKDVAGIARALDQCFTDWLAAPLGGDRGQSAAAIAGELSDAPVSGTVETVESLPAALDRALADSEPDDRVVVFGSFLTVAEAWPKLASSLNWFL